MAGSRIKGITVEIGGDTTKLQTALSTSGTGKMAFLLSPLAHLI